MTQIYKSIEKKQYEIYLEIGESKVIFCGCILIGNICHNIWQNKNYVYNIFIILYYNITKWLILIAAMQEIIWIVI